jgi:hypothetical protein
LAHGWYRRPEPGKQLVRSPTRGLAFGNPDAVVQDQAHNNIYSNPATLNINLRSAVKNVNENSHLIRAIHCGDLRWAPAVQNFCSRRTRKNKFFSAERGCVMRIQKWALFARWQVFNFAQLAPQLTTAIVHTEEQRTSAIAGWLAACVFCVAGGSV